MPGVASSKFEPSAEEECSPEMGYPVARPREAGLHPTVVCCGGGPMVSRSSSPSTKSRPVRYSSGGSSRTKSGHWPTMRFSKNREKLHLALLALQFRKEAVQPRDCIAASARVARRIFGKISKVLAYAGPEVLVVAASDLGGL
ncbi:uncharacterized protein LOC106866613 isoform X2 [Brachypodium distachyon]|uniref:uncharacterized protein LOC106866613 isoform X2 n=1 Tax=Brachypodium distachyon TaxID=15368 RepID=UPI00071D7CA3|nr:uncharacterized protein LOC106866613 isoform X2 [Brachypodium distachyon]|eukprot:XP_014757561.1 uncharacterized protein LOC106866613 isoform X2 [Brachypodium distachyon]